MDDQEENSLCCKVQQLYEEKEKLLQFFGFCDKSFYSKCINNMEEEFEGIKQLMAKVGLLVL